jgi:uncharacterized membrane protein YvlD (DUF360 family)
MLRKEIWLPAAAFVVPALVWLALEGRAYPPFEPYMTGDYAKIELYTRLAAEGSQRLGTESRFHIHHLGPAFFYFAAPIYYLFGATTKGMAVAALAWNLLFLVALLRGASRLAPRSGPFVAALVLLAFLQARGIGWLLSSWNPHLAMLPFGVALLACARLATGEGRALWILALAGSVVLQGHMVWAPPLALGGAFGLLLCLWPRLRAALGIPTRGEGIGRRSVLATIGVASVLWAMPVYDELTGSYKNFRRILTMGTESYESRPWADSLGPCLRALDLRRDGQAPGASFEFGARNVGVDPRLGTEADPIAGGAAFGWRELLRAALPLIALVVAGVLARRRGSPIVAVVVVALLAMATLPVVALRSPGRELPWYLLQWGAMVTLVALLAFGIELVERIPWLGRQSRGVLGTAVLAAIPLLLVASALRSQSLAPTRPRNPRSVAVERMAAIVKERAALDIGKRRFLVRVAPHEDQALAVGLILALDKRKISFSVEPFGSCRFEGRFTPRGNEWAELLVGNLEARPGAVRVDAGDGVSVVWQLKQVGGAT